MIDRNIEFKIGEKTRGFRLGNYGFMIACQQAGITSTEELFNKIKAGDLLVTLAVAYGAAVHYAKNKKQDIDFNDADVSDWFDELGEEKSREIFASMLKVYPLPKNLPPLETGATNS